MNLPPKGWGSKNTPTQAVVPFPPPPIPPPLIAPPPLVPPSGTELALRAPNVPMVLKPLGDGTLTKVPALLPHDSRMTPATNPAGLYGFQGMMDDPYPPGFEIEADREEPPPPPHVERLPGYLEEPLPNLKETEKLVYGPGARRDAGGVLGMGLPKLSQEQAMLIQRAKKYAMEVSIKMVLMKQTLAHQQQQTKYLQRQQAVSIMSRIYVGCINYDTKEEAIKQAFLPFGPIRSITMSWDSMTGKHKGFAFVEFEQPEAAQLALDQMNGILVCSRNIKVGRPSQMPQAQACIDEIQREAKDFNRLYVASIHKDLTDDDIKSVFSAFGTIKTCELASAGIPGRHKGYGYIEYESSQSTQEAISSMNLFDLGGQFLRVGRAITPPDTRVMALSGGVPSALPSAAAVAAAAVTAKMQAMDAVASNLGVDASQLQNTMSLPSSTPQLPAQIQIRKCGLPRDADGRPIKAMSQIIGKRSRSRSRERTPRSPRRSRGSRGRSRSRDNKSRDRDRERDRSRDKERSSRDRDRNRDKDRDRDRKKERSPEDVKKEPEVKEVKCEDIPKAIPPPPTIPVSSFQPPQPPEPLHLGIGEAQQQAARLESEKGLQDEGEPVTLKQQEDMQIKGKSARQMVMQRLMGARGKMDSKVLLLKNMVGAEDVDEELQEEIQQECSKYGKVENVVIYQEKQDEADDAEIHVKIFVEFNESLDVKKAKNALDGRFFGGRTVSAFVYDQELFDQQDYSA